MFIRTILTFILAVAFTGCSTNSSFCEDKDADGICDDAEPSECVGEEASAYLHYTRRMGCALTAEQQVQVEAILAETEPVPEPVVEFATSTPVEVAEEVESTPELVPEVSDPQDCPSDPIDRAYLDRVLRKLVDPTSESLFTGSGEGWDTSYGNPTGNPERVRVRFGGYRFWHNPIEGEDLGGLNVWEGSWTGSDDLKTGCLNLAVADEGVMAWQEPNRDDQRLDLHGDSQIKYVRAVRALAAKLGVR